MRIEKLSLTLEEQEVHVSFGRLDNKAIIYTSDTRYINKFNKLTAVPDSEWKLEETVKLKSGEVVGCTYSCPINLISFRTKTLKRNLSDFQKVEKQKELMRGRTISKISSKFIEESIK
ncbi:MAG: hypothetical protein K2P44_11530 [Lachnospiraceae bacterium]|nr:hypothetical protein [Lachnospiraceae bacterium]